MQQASLKMQRVFFLQSDNLLRRLHVPVGGENSPSESLSTLVLAHLKQPWLRLGILLLTEG